MFGFSASTGGLFELHTLHMWEFNSSLELSNLIAINPNSSSPAYSPAYSPALIVGQKGNHAWLSATIGSLGDLALIIVLVSAWFCCLLSRNRNNKTGEAKEEI